MKYGPCAKATCPKLRNKRMFTGGERKENKENKAKVKKKKKNCCHHIDYKESG